MREKQKGKFGVTGNKLFATRVFQQFFSNERTKLELMSKEQLIEVIMQWKSEK